MAKCIKCGQRGLMLKVNADGICLDCASKDLAEMKALITPELRDVIDAKKLLEKEKEALSEAKKETAIAQSKLKQTKIQIQAAESQLIVASDAVEMESFSLYSPRFSFTTSEEYKQQLDETRAWEKKLIKDKEATICPSDWSVNGSKAEGRKFTQDISKLFIRSFNNECDIAIADAKFSNYARCKERIDRSFHTINALGRINRVSLTETYKQLKLKELALAYEYQCKKQEEKEALRALREQQREEAKVAKEIEAARKEAEKEKKHYIQALEKIQAQIADCKSEKDRLLLIVRQNEVTGFLDDLNQKMEDIDYRQSNQRAGYVYVISNIGSFGPDVYKIGMTRRLDPMERVYELGDASVPFVFDVHAMIFSDDAPALEAALHHAFESKRVNMVNNRREYFRVSLDEIKAVVRKNHDKTVEFIDVPDAQQYRETMKMAHQA